MQSKVTICVLKISQTPPGLILTTPRITRMSNDLSITTYTAFFDGACEPVNPGGVASYGAIIYANGDGVWSCSELYVPEKGHERETSNNVAEYSGLLAVLDWFTAQKLYDADITVHGDSKLVINQVFGTWKIKDGRYVPLAHDARRMAKDFKKMRGVWIPRGENTVADELSKAALKAAGVKLRLQPA